MRPEEYGEKFSDHFLEQYKLYVEMADRISQRREQSNRFYVALLTSLAALLVILARFGLDTENDAGGFLKAVILAIGALGSVLAIIWFVNIKSYRQLNTAKFQIINRMEKQLPFAGYSDEWELLRPKSGPSRYFQLTRVEQFVPLAVFALFAVITAYSAFLLFS